jgi:hypothetical protein
MLFRGTAGINLPVYDMFVDLRILITPLVSSNSSLYKLNLLDVYAIGPIVVAMGFDNVCCTDQKTQVNYLMCILYFLDQALTVQKWYQCSLYDVSWFSQRF